MTGSRTLRGPYGQPVSNRGTAVWLLLVPPSTTVVSARFWRKKAVCHPACRRPSLLL